MSTIEVCIIPNGLIPLSQEIRMIIDELIRRGKELYDAVVSEKESIKSFHDRVETGVDLASLLGYGKGKKTLIKKTSKILTKPSHKKKMQEYYQAFRNWFEQIISLMRTISIKKPSITASGNSQQLVRKFNKVKRYKNLDVKIRHSLSTLEVIKEEELIYNREIPAFIEEMKQVSQLEKQISSYLKSELDTIRIDDLNFLSKELESYPSEREAIFGAIERYKMGGTDSFRQCLSSCRNALENLIKKITNTADWNVGLKKITKSQTKERLIKQAYAYLSAYGVHGDKIPARDDTELGLRIAISCILWIIEIRQNKDL